MKLKNKEKFEKIINDIRILEKTKEAMCSDNFVYFISYFQIIVICFFVMIDLLGFFLFYNFGFFEGNTYSQRVFISIYVISMFFSITVSCIIIGFIFDKKTLIYKSKKHYIIQKAGVINSNIIFKCLPEIEKVGMKNLHSLFEDKIKEFKIFLVNKEMLLEFHNRISKDEIFREKFNLLFVHCVEEYNVKIKAENHLNQRTNRALENIGLEKINIKKKSENFKIKEE